MNKKLIIKISAAVLAAIVLYGVYSLYFKRTPERLLEWNFNISLEDFDYTVESFDEQWCPNGDGYVLIIFKFKELTQNNIDYLKKVGLQTLPISKANSLQMVPNIIPNEYWYSDTGYYIYELESPTDQRNFKVFIVDAAKKTAVLYYQIM